METKWSQIQLTWVVLLVILTFQPHVLAWPIITQAHLRRLLRNHSPNQSLQQHQSSSESGSQALQPLELAVEWRERVSKDNGNWQARQLLWYVSRELWCSGFFWCCLELLQRNFTGDAAFENQNDLGISRSPRLVLLTAVNYQWRRLQRIVKIQKPNPRLRQTAHGPAHAFPTLVQIIKPSQTHARYYRWTGVVPAKRLALHKKLNGAMVGRLAG